MIFGRVIQVQKEMKEDKLNCETEKEIDIQALVFIECIDDKEIKENCRKYFTSLGKKDIKKKETIFSNQLEENYEFYSENYRIKCWRKNLLLLIIW